MSFPLRHCIASLLLALACCLVPAISHAQSSGREHVYIVAHGDNVGSIAQHLGVPTRALIDRNHLHSPYPLRVGRRLRLPDGVAPDVLRHLPYRDDDSTSADGSGSSGSGSHDSRGDRDVGSAEPYGHGHERRHGRPNGVVHLVRESNGETMTINLRRVSFATRRRMGHFLRFPDGRQMPMNEGLLRRIAIVSDHFGGRRLHVVSGFRPWRRGQWTAHSNHNVGRAMDFRVEGVPNRVLRDFCTTIPHTGCGFYPRSVFVHMDARAESAVWVDWSRPGQRPMYGSMARPPSGTETASAHGHGRGRGHAPAAGSEDESVDDVAADSNTVRTAAAANDGDGEGTDPPAGSDDHAGTATGGTAGATGGGSASAGGGSGGSGGSSGASGAAASGN